MQESILAEIDMKKSNPDHSLSARTHVYILFTYYDKNFPMRNFSSALGWQIESKNNKQTLFTRH